MGFGQFCLGIEKAVAEWARCGSFGLTSIPVTISYCAEKNSRGGKLMQLDGQMRRSLRRKVMGLYPCPAYDGFHVWPPKPDGAAASQRRIAGGEDNLLVRAHQENFLGLYQRSGRQLPRSRPR